MTLAERVKLLEKRQRCARCGHYRMDHVAGLGRIDSIGSMECVCTAFASGKPRPAAREASEGEGR